MARHINLNNVDILALLSGGKKRHRLKDKENSGRGELFPGADLGQKFKVGDLLWVREEISVLDCGVGIGGNALMYNIRYLADGLEKWLGTDAVLNSLGAKRAHDMPKFASRFTLELNAVQYQKSRHLVDLRFNVHAKNIEDFEDE